MQKMKWLAGAAMMMAGAVSASLITIDEASNGGANIAEYGAQDNTDPYSNEIANAGSGSFEVGRTVGSNANGLSRTAFYFQIPTGYTSAQVTNAVLSFRLNAKNSPTTELDIYSAYATSLGTKDATFAKSMYSDASFTDTGLGLGTGAAILINSFDVTSLVKAAIDQGNPTNVIAFRFQMKNDTTFAYKSINNYQIIGFGATTETYRPNLVLETIPEPTTAGLMGIVGGLVFLVRHHFVK